MEKQAQVWRCDGSRREEDRQEEQRRQSEEHDVWMDEWMDGDSQQSRPVPGYTAN